MTDNCLIDTSIIVYAFDAAEPLKRGQSKTFIEARLDDENVYISNQVFAELFHVLTSVMRSPLPKEQAETIVRGFVDSPAWKKITYTSATVVRAMHLSKQFRVDFWDSLIAATMIENDVFTIYTENEKDFRKIPLLKVVNPLK